MLIEEIEEFQRELAENNLPFINEGQLLIDRLIPNNPILREMERRGIDNEITDTRHNALASILSNRGLYNNAIQRVNNGEISDSDVIISIYRQIIGRIIRFRGVNLSEINILDTAEQIYNYYADLDSDINQLIDYHYRNVEVGYNSDMSEIYIGRNLQYPEFTLYVEDGIATFYGADSFDGFDFLSIYRTRLTNLLKTNNITWN
ncbi:hypothetical protein [Galbibacter pacificus]|uniref:Uncharacterized protein n=1 Tax=Galbibacter pacificus TaxID=2996052 RepID=A0ABT6FR57_9FLAO|nr:hypothetical protein [Galbibacter pacificus]MDG3581777.1 hypothetical protein [Galbibacter pacificus]MDG3585749.1 hypothetical protein [Galbibacter pacificus]